MNNENFLMNYYNNKRKHIIDKCTKCGLCYKKCSIDFNTYENNNPSEIQQKVVEFLDTGKENKLVNIRGLACLECYKCVNNTCPQGISPLQITSLIKYDLRNNKNKSLNFDVKEYNESVKSNLREKLNTSDYSKLTTKTHDENNKYLFFPGCNVYKQPDKILKSIKIIEQITSNFSFLPGLDNCCGVNPNYYGDLTTTQESMGILVEELNSLNIETVILWCPTCLCMFNTIIKDNFNINFRVISIGQFIYENINKLNIKREVNKIITLHEPCKTSFMELDLDSVENILKKIPKVDYINMERSKKNTICCGLGAEIYSKDVANNIKIDRLEEAKLTNCNILCDVCHACHSFFLEEKEEYDFEILNYIDIIAYSLGLD